MVDVGARHFAHQRNAADGIGVGALLRGADGRDGQCAVTVCAADEGAGVLHRDTRHRAGGRQQDDVCTSGGEVGNVCLGQDALGGLGQHAGGVHFACRQHDAVPHGRLKFAQRLDDSRVGHAHAGVSGEEDEVDAQLFGSQGVFHRGAAPGRHFPDGVCLALLALGHRLQIDADGAARHFFEHTDGVFRLRFRQAVDDRVLHIEHVQQQDVRTHRGRELGVGHIAQQRLHRTDGLASNDAPLAFLDGFEKITFGKAAEIRRAAIK